MKSPLAHHHEKLRRVLLITTFVVLAGIFAMLFLFEIQTKIDPDASLTSRVSVTPVE